ncbi:TonB-dependent siderophore receptor [Rhizobacter sp. P5_C2]
MRSLPRQRLLVVALAAAFSGPFALPHALAQAAVQAPNRDEAEFDLQVPAQPLDAALNELSRQTGLPILAAGETAAGKTSRAVSGRLSAAQALQQMLAGSGLEAARAPNGGFAIRQASATTAAAETTLPALNVRARADADAGGYVAHRASVGTKTDAPLVEVPQSISVIGSQEIDDKGLTTLTDALAQTPGVTVNPYGFDSRGLDWVLLRGFDGWYTSSFRDGLAQNVGITFLGVQTEVYGLDRLEVLRGPSSVLFGKGDVGGVVNRVSKVPGPDAVREIGVQTGRYDRKQVMADLGGAIDAEGQWRWRVVGLGLDTGTQDQYPNGERMTQKRQYLAPSLKWQPTPQTSLTLQAELLRDDGSDDVQFVSDSNGQPTTLKEGDPSYSRIETGSDAIGWQFAHRFDSGWKLQQNARYAHRTSDKHHIQSFFLDPTAPNLLDRQARHDVEAVDENSIDTSVQGKVDGGGGVSHTLLFGLDIDRSRAEWQRWQDMTTPLDLTNPVYGIPIAEPSSKARDKQVILEQVGLYAQDQVRFDSHWGLTVGVRQDRVKSRYEDRMPRAGEVGVAERTDNATSGRLGVTYQVGNGWAPYASYGESFVPVMAVDEGKLLDPSRGKQVELGVKYMPEGEAVSFTAAVFNLEKTNVVTYDAEFAAHAIGKVRSRGIELEARAALSPRLRLTGSFSALDMKVLSSLDSTEVGNMPILTPKQTAALWLDYALGAEVLRGVSVGGGLRYIGKRWDNVANTESQPAYTLADAAVRYDNGPWRFALNVTNLFDKQYLSGHAYGSYFRGTERNVLLTAKYRF